MSEKVHICLGGPDREIVIDGERFRFEDHPYFGPMPLTKRGNERTLGARHKFWRVATWWYEQGKKLAPDGTCEWSTPPDPREGMVNIGGNHWTTPAVYQRLLAKVRQP